MFIFLTEFPFYRASAVAKHYHALPVTGLTISTYLLNLNLVGFREAFSVLKEAGCSDEALCYEMYVLSTIDHHKN